MTREEAINALSAIEDIKQAIWVSHKDNYCKSEIINLIDKHTMTIKALEQESQESEE